MGKNNDNMQRDKYLHIRRGSVMLMVLLLCVGLIAGCGRTKEDGIGQDPAGLDRTDITSSADGIQPSEKITPTDVPTPTPTPLPFVQQAYETYGRDDVYRVPIENEEKNRARISTLCAGEYVLNLYTVWGEDENSDAGNLLILISPGVSTDQYSAAPEYPINQPILLSDGTVILTEWETGMVHIYDCTLTEVRAFVPDVEGIPQTVGVSDEGILWVACEGDAKLRAFDLTGELKGEYEFDGQLMVTMYLGRFDGKEYFYTATTGEEYIGGYMYLSVESGEIEYRSKDDPDLGDAWSRSISIPMGGWDISYSDSTWFFHVPGSACNGISFPKADLCEGICFLNRNWLCGCVCKWDQPVGEIDDFSVGDIRDYRLYDLNKRVVSEVISESEIPDCSFLSAQGMVGDRYVLFLALTEAGEEELLLWSPGNEFSQIPEFCDFAKDDPLAALAEQVDALKEDYGIEITPDLAGAGREAVLIGDIMSEIEFINTLKLGVKTYPEIFKTASGDAIRPENIRNNDGAHYEFDPHVFSSYYLKEHGEERRDVFFRYVDALRAGEDSFECPNTGAANWSSGRLATYFFPVGAAYAYAEYIGDGRAKIVYRIPREEFLEKEREFEERVMAIVNDAVEEDYSDLEKALALYEFMTEYCEYDYEMLYHSVDWMEQQSGYRVLVEKQGICWEIACLYRYLLLQCGVDAEETTGMPLNPDDELHEWNYIELDGQGYLIDATWGITDERQPDLKYFLFTDEMRKERDGYDPESFDLAGNGLYGARKKYGFKADDERYSELWDGRYIAFDEQEKCIFYKDLNGEIKRFYYGSEESSLPDQGA